MYVFINIMEIPHNGFSWLTDIGDILGNDFGERLEGAL